MKIGLVAEPWWVNLAVLVPVVAYFSWRRRPVPLTAKQLIIVGVFASAFGFLEATVVVYLRAGIGSLPGYRGTLSDAFRLSYQLQGIGELPPSLLTLEVLREAATLIMLSCTALLASVKTRARLAAFLWAFAIWDLVYYAALWVTVSWPHSLGDTDVLFLIPEPWFAPVWFPLLVSILALAAVLITRASPGTPPVGTGKRVVPPA
jgi:hypothetical protein